MESSEVDPRFRHQRCQPGARTSISTAPVFAGSLYALGILTAWGLCDHLIALGGLDAELVVAEASIRYLAPVRRDILCHCSASDSAAEAFISELTGRGRSRIALEVTIGEGPAAVIEAVMHDSRDVG